VGSRAGSPRRSRSRSRSRSRGRGSDKEDGGDEQDKVIADIFGSSDDEDEFEGFDASEVPKKEKKKKTAIKSDDEDEGASGLPDEGEAPPEGSDDDNDDAVRRDAGGDNDKLEYASDFDVMMAKRKEEMQKSRRKRKDVDLINDNDDLIADLIVKMKEAANSDRELNQAKKASNN